MKKQLLLALLLSLIYLGVTAQPCPPVGSPAPSFACEDAPLFCDGIPDGYCFATTNSGVQSNPGGFCGGNSSVQNNQWFSFMAGTTTIGLEVTVGACQTGDGLQGLVYEGCGPPWVTVSNCFFQMAPGSVSVFNLVNLNPGSVYFLMIDGFSGDNCGYEINTTYGSTVAPAVDPAMAITGVATICPGAGPQTYTVPLVDGAGFYTWNLPPGASIIGSDDGNTVTIDWGNSGGGTISVLPANQCQIGTESPQFVVTSQAPPPNPPQSATLCQGDPPVTIEGESYNWAPGTQVYQNMNATNALGCPILTEVTIIGALDQIVTIPSMVICDGDPAVTVGGQQFLSTGPIEVTIPTSLGCDSTINSYLTVLEPSAGIFPPSNPSIVSCNGNVTLTAVVVNQSPNVVYSWSGPCIEPDFDPTDASIEVSCGGTYTLNVIETEGGVTCISDPFDIVVQENLVLPISDAGPDAVIDCSSPFATIGGPNTTPGALYSWINTVPGNGYSSTQANPDDVPSPGTYCLTVIDLNNGCISFPDCVNVTGDVTPPTAMASANPTILSCANGTATLSATGSSTGNVTYTWTGPSGTLTGASPTVTQGGTYTLVVTNNDTQCESVPVTVSIGTDTAPPTAFISFPGSNAIDCNNPSITLSANGSTGLGLSYNWSTGSTTSTTDVMMDGTYTLTVTGSNGCEDITTTVVNNNSATLSANIEVIGQLTCTNNMVTLNAINISGTTNPTYIWTDPMNTQIPGTTGSASIMVSTGGNYTLVIEDNSNGCASTAVVEIVASNTDLPTAVAGANLTTIDCDNTSAILDPSGSTTGNITYSWTGPNGALTGSNPSVMQSGIYTLTVLNNDTGCETPATVEIFSDVAPPNAVIDAPIAIDCNNPTITLNGANSTGTGTLSYAWSNGGSTTSTLDVTADGDYTVIVTAANGCTDEATVSVINNTTTVDVTATASNTITCGAPSSVLSVASLTGSNNPTYEWLDSNNSPVGNGTNMATVMNAGTYTVNIVDGTTGCIGFATVVVIEDAVLPVSEILPPASLTCTQTTVNLDGSGSSTGNNYTYEWFLNGTLVQSATTNLLSVTTEGNYTLVVTDSNNGCQTTSSITNVALDNQEPTAVAVASDNGVISCDIDDLTIDGSSSTGTNITYEWSDALGNILGNAPTLTVASAGVITLTVTNGVNGCDNSTDVTITPDANVPTLNIDPILPINCNNTTIDLVGSGNSSAPNGTVTFQWLDETNQVVSTTEMYQTSTPGTYTFIVTDPGNGCSQSSPVIVEENIEEPIVDVGLPQTIDCNNNMVTLNGSNSTGGDEYQWLDENNVPVPGGNTPVLTTMTSGQYTLVVTNSVNGCDNSMSVVVDENLQAPEISGTAANNIDCDNVEAMLQGQVINSFSTDLSYQWTNSSGGILSTDITANAANEGIIVLTVTDNSNGCSATFDVPVENTTATPEATAIASDNATLDCNINAVTLDATGSLDSAGVTYNWTLDGNPVSTDLAFSAAAPGLYILEVINGNNGCTNTFNVLVEEDIEAPATDVSASVDLLTCSSTISTLNGSNSSTGDEFIYAWVDVVTGLTISTDITFDVSVASTYQLTVTDTVNGCVSTSLELVIDQDANIPVADAIIQNSFNLDCNNSEVTLDGSGSTGIGTLTYEWTDPDGNPIGTGESTVTVAAPGAYVLNIIDGANGCEVAANPVIVVEDLVAPVVDAGLASTLNCNQPTYTLDGTGSTLDPNITYTYNWTLAGISVGTTLSIPDVAAGGIYQLEITNTVNGCTSLSDVDIDEDFEAPTANAGNNFTITCADTNAPLDGSASSAMGDFSYVWTNQAGDTVSTSISDIINAPGDYTLVVTNNVNGCFTASAPIEIGIDADLPTVEIVTPAPTITCFDNQFVTLDGSGSDAGAGITYQWSLNGVDLPGETSAFLTTNQPGDHVLTVFNSNTGCGDFDMLTVLDDLEAPVADAGTGGTLICGQANLPLDGSASSSTGNFTYEWYSFDPANSTLQNQVGTGVNFAAGSAGDYVIVVTNIDNGCSSISASVLVDQDANIPTIDIAPALPLNCITNVITVDGSGSTANVGNLVYEWTDANNVVIGTGPTVDVMTPGSITLLITDDANNCASTSSVLVVEDIAAPMVEAGVEATLLCSTTDVTLDGGGSAINMNYQWLDPNNMPVGGNSTVLTTSIPGNYTLVVTNPVNGCVSQDFVQVFEDINLPTANTVFNGEINCNVDAIPVDGSTSIAAGGGALTYSWSDGSNSAATTFMQAGTYTLTVTDAINGCSSTSIFAIDDDFTQPIVDIAGISNNTITCDNSSLVYNGSNSASSTGGIITYEWLLDGTPVGTLDEIEISSAGDLTLVVTNVDNGCSATSNIVQIDLDVNLPNLNIATPEVLNCIDNTVTLNGTGSATGTNIEYLWTGPGTIDGETTLMPTVNTSGNYTLTLVNTETGCQTTGLIFVDADIDLPQAVANANDEFDCVTDEVTLDGNGSASGSNITYSWTTSTGTFIGGNNTFAPTIGAPGEYTIIVTNIDNGCVNQASIDVTANTDVPVIDDFQVATPNCFGENNASILLDGVNGGQLPYLYSLDGSAFASANQFSFLSSGEYNIVVQDANGCESEVNITINEPAELLVELGDDITIGLGDTIALSPQIIGAYDTIIWTNCVLDNCFTPVLDSVGPINTSQYGITLIDGNGCVATDDITVFVEKGREVFIPNVFTPNGDGNNDRFWVFAGQEAFKVYEFRVFNRWGEQVYATFDYDPQIQTNTNGWDGTFDGKEMNPAVFVYYLDIEYIDGRREILKGDVALRR